MFQISCHGKYNNPVPHFTLEVRLSKTGKSIVLQKSSNLTFKVSDLKPGSMYTANVKAVNKFGKSEALFISFVTQAEPVKSIAETKVKGERNDGNEVIGVILGIVVTSVIMLFVLTTTYRRCQLEPPDTRLVSDVVGNSQFPGHETVIREVISHPKKIPSSSFDSYHHSMQTISSDVLVKVY